MYNALDVSRYIINYSNDKNYGISNLKLQKILYFVQAYFLTSTEDHHPCFSDTIEAWNFGPVVPSVYHEFKQYGAGDIPSIQSYINFDSSNVWNSERVEYKNYISQEDQDRINAVVDKFSDYSASDLVALTHRQSPWIDAYAPYRNNEITNEAIRKYFTNE
ncbi:MAG TPA: hypothetical protein DIS88_08710 [Prevotella sp.]|nr:hypothetical protein [Prevotella sp.]